MEVIKTCPLGSDCQTIINNQIHQCRWLTNIKGVNPNTGDAVDELGCAMEFLPVLLINTANEARQGAAATESFRNAVITATQQRLNDQRNHG